MDGPRRAPFGTGSSLSLPLPLSSCFITLLSLWWFTQLWPGGSQMIVKSWLARGKSCMLMTPQRPFSLFSCSLVKGRESDGFPEMQDRLVRQALKEFPYPESQLLQQLVRQIAPIKIVSAEAPTKHYHRNRKRPGAFLVVLMDSGGSHHLIIICNIYIAPNPTRLAQSISQFKSGSNITIKTWDMHTPDDPAPTAKCRQTCTHPGTINVIKTCSAAIYGPGTHLMIANQMQRGCVCVCVCVDVSMHSFTV